MILIDRKTRKQIVVGDEVKAAYGKTGTLIGIEHPNEARSGKVYVDIAGIQYYWYPSAIGAEFVPAGQNLKRAVGKAMAIKKERSHNDV